MNRFAYLAAAICLSLALQSCAGHGGQTVPSAQQNVSLADLKQLAAKVAVTSLAKVGQRLDALQGVAIPSYLMSAVAALNTGVRKPTAIATSESASLVAVAGVPVVQSSARRTPSFLGGGSPGGGLCYYEMYYHYEDGQIVVDEVDFLYCDDGYVPSEGGGGDGSGTPTPAPLPSGWTQGCSSGDAHTNQRNTALYNMSRTFQAAQQSGREAYGFIAKNNTDGTLIYFDAGQAVLNGNVAQVNQPATPNGYTIIAYVHTHPDNYSTTGDTTGIDSYAAGADPANIAGQPDYTNNLFSVIDLTGANSANLDAYVEVEANDSSGNLNYEFGEWTHGGTVGQNTNYTQGSVGQPSSQGAPTWNQC